MKKDWRPRQKPNLFIGGFRLWVRGREFPESQDYWDANWLNVIVYCSSQNSNVWVTGSIIHLSELKDFRADLEGLLNSSKRIAVLETMEPYLKLEFEDMSEKEIKMKVYITPDQAQENHSYFFEVGHSDLQRCLGDVTNILENYAIKDKP